MLIASPADIEAYEALLYNTAGESSVEYAEEEEER